MAESPIQGHPPQMNMPFQPKLSLGLLWTIAFGLAPTLLAPAARADTAPAPATTAPINLALHKTYECSDPNLDHWGTGGLTDGSWVPDGKDCFATGRTDTFPKTVTIDLETPASVAYVMLGVPGFGATETIVASVSLDDQNFNEVGRYVFTQGKQENYLFSFPAAPARYVRLTYPDHYPRTINLSPLTVYTVEAEVYADGPAPALAPLGVAVPEPRQPADVAAPKLAGDGTINPGFLAMHEKYIERGKAGPIGVLFIGDSITAGWQIPTGLWKNNFGQFNPANFGIPGDGTQHVLWRIENGELDGIAPKVVVVLIGTNNMGYPADDIVKADTKIVATIHEKLPDTKVLLLGIFPRGADITKVGPTRDKIKAINLELAKLDDGDKTRFLDIGDKFLDADGNLPADTMPDGLHPNAKGYQIWADAMLPLLTKMMQSAAP